jgi:hypothetical protein
MVRMDFGRLHCRQPKITQAQFAYLAIYLVLITRQDGEIKPLIRSIADEILGLQREYLRFRRSALGCRAFRGRSD